MADDLPILAPHEFESSTVAPFHPAFTVEQDDHVVDAIHGLLPFSLDQLDLAEESGQLFVLQGELCLALEELPLIFLLNSYVAYGHYQALFVVQLDDVG